MGKIKKAIIPLAAAGAALGFAFAPSASAATPRVLHAAETGSGLGGTLFITDPDGFGHTMSAAEYFMHDGYAKIVHFTTPTVVKAADIQDCGTAADQGTNGGVPNRSMCHPVLHQSEVFFQAMGSLQGRDVPPVVHVVTENTTGSGPYLTVGEINHGAMMEIDYTWTNGETVHILLKGDSLVNRVVLVNGSGYNALLVRDTNLPGGIV